MGLATACSVDDREIIRARDAGGCASACGPGEACVSGVCACRTDFIPPAGALAAWFDASCLPTGPLSRWRDVGGEHNDAVQPSADATPLVRANALGAMHAVRFDGVSHYLALPDRAAPDANGSFTVLLAGSWDRIASTYNGVVGWGGRYGVHLMVNPGGNIFMWWGVDNQTNAASPGVPNATPVVLTYVYDSAGSRDLGTMTLYINGEVKASAAAQFANTARGEGVYLGRSLDFAQDTNQMLGYLGEVFIYGRALSDREINRVNEYLQQRWTR